MEDTTFMTDCFSYRMVWQIELQKRERIAKTQRFFVP
jgi:hypothetical protein